MVAALYDHLGNLVRSSELTAGTQTSRIGYLAQEFGDHPSRGLTPAKLARILEDAERGDLTSQARLGEDMEEKDAHIYAELSKRRRCVIGVDWRIEPPIDASPREKEDSARVEEIIRNLDWETIVYDAAAAVLYGYSCQEIEWDRSEGEWLPKAVSYRPADWFMTPPDARDDLRLRTLGINGEPLRPFGWIVHRHKAKSGYLVRGALTRVLAWPFLFRNYSARDLAEFLEIYGLPLRLGKYPPGAGDEEKSTLMRAVVGIGHAAGGIIPEGMSIEFQEAAKGGGDPFVLMIDWAERSISKAILGGTLTSQTSASGGGAYALGQVHNEVRRDILSSDLKQIAATMTHFLAEPLARLNTPMTRMPRWVFDDRDIADIATYADALPKLVNVGLRIPVSWAHTQLGIPEAAEDEPVLEAAAVPGFQDYAAATAVPGRTAQAAAQVTAQASDVVDAQADRLEQEADKPITAMIDTVKKIIESANTLEELRDGLLDAWPEMDSRAFADVMAEALSAAALAGRFDILEGL